MKTARRSAALISSGALIALLAACGNDDGNVTEPGGDTTPTQGPETEGTETEGTEGGATETEGTEGGATETEGTETEGTEGGATETEGTEGGGSTEAGTEIDPQELMDRLQSVDESILGTFTMEMTADTMGQVMTMSGVADLLGDAPAMDVEMSMMGMDMRMILVDGAGYMQMPGLTEEGMFVEIPASELEGELDLNSQVDMTEQWDAWEQADSVRFIGRENIDGEDMDHYVLTLSSDLLAEDSPEMAELPGGMPSTIEYEVWVDDQNLMRQVSFDIGSDMSTELQMYGWGEPVTIEAPAADQIMDGSGLGF